MKEFKSLYKDTNYRNNPKGTWQNAKNILLSKKFNSPVNRDGSKFINQIENTGINNRDVISTMSTNQEIVYFVKVLNGNVDSEIWLYDEINDNLYVAIRGNFNFNRNIESIFFYDYQGSLIIAFCDGVFEESNTPKIIKLTNTNLPLLDNNMLPSNYYDLIELFPNINQGICNAYTSEGNIEGVFAYVTFKYVHDDELETRFKDVNTYCSLRELNFQTEEYEPKGIKVKLKDLKHNTYSYIKIGIHLIKESSSISYESDKINIDNSNKEINIETLSTYNQISNEEILIPKATFKKAETFTNHNDSILAGKVKTSEKINIQKYANLIKLRPLTEQDLSEDVDKKNLPLLMNHEVYNVFVQAEFKDGSKSDWHHIPGNPKTDYSETLGSPLDNQDDAIITDPNNADDYNDLHALYENNYNQDIFNLKDFHLINTGNSSIFGYFEDEQTYPHDDNYNSTYDYNGDFLGGENLRGQNIRYFKVPEKVDCYGFKMTSLNFPNYIKNKITNVRIGFEKRTFNNSLIVSNGVMCPVNRLNQGINDNNLEFFNYEEQPSSPFNYESDVRLDSVYSYNRALFINPEVEELKPKLNYNLTIVDDVIYSGAINNGNNAVDFDTAFSYVESLKEDYFNVYLKNKYYFNKPEYQYKLPNNFAQGCQYLDGGLHINYGRSHVAGIGLIDNGFGFYNVAESNANPVFYTKETVVNDNTIFYFNNSFLPISFNSAIVYTGNKVNRELPSKKPVSLANVYLVNIKKSLYGLKGKNVVASLNTIKIDLNSPIINGNFYCGDVYKCKVEPNIKHRVGNHYSVLKDSKDYHPALNKILEIKSSFKNSKVSFKDNSLSSYGFNINSDSFQSTPLKIFIDDIETLNSLNYGFNNSFNENENSLNDLAQYKIFDLDDKFINYFRYRFYRGSKAPNEAFILNNLKTFIFNNYYEMPNHKGDIVALRSNGYSLYIQMRFSLYLAKIKDVLKTNEQETYLGEGDILDRKPTPMSIDKKGFIGCDHKSACHIFKEGYFTIDHRKGNIVLATDSAQVVTNGITNWLLENLPFGEDYTEILENGDKVYIDEPFKNKGFAIGYDNNYGHVFITKLQGDKSFTLTMNLSNKQFLCYNDFLPNAYDTLNQNIYITKKFENTNKIELLFKGDKGVYFGVKYPSYIDLIFNASPDIPKHYDAFEIFTTAVKEQTRLVRKTINKLIVFNDYQCSKEIVLDLENKDIIRFAEGKYRVNNIKDIVIDSEDTIIDEQGNINFDNLNMDMFWKNKNDFISNYLIIRLIWDNDTNEDIYLNEFKVLSRKSIR